MIESIYVFRYSMSCFSLSRKLDSIFPFSYINIIKNIHNIIIYSIKLNIVCTYITTLSAMGVKIFQFLISPNLEIKLYFSAL